MSMFLAPMRLEFGRSATKNCKALVGNATPKDTVQAWAKTMISGADSNVLTFRIGPSGGDKGYNAWTGENR